MKQDSTKTSHIKIWKGFVKKEFLHVIRDRRTLLVMFGLPIALILIFGFALTNEVKNAKLLIIDPKPNTTTQQLIQKIDAGSYFTVQYIENSTQNLNRYFRQKKIECAIILPSTTQNTIQILLDATDPNFAKTIINYLSLIINDFTAQQHQLLAPHLPYIAPAVHMLYNPSLNGSMTFVPGLIALIMMIVCTSLTAVSIVREKETGTMETILVSPIKPILILIAKAVPYFILSIINLIIILILSNLILNIPIRGNLLLLFFESTLYILTCLSLGLLISNLTNSQAIAMLISMSAVLLPTLLLTGFLFPLENMPIIFQWIANIIPAKWYNDIVTGIMLKGVGIQELWRQTSIMIGMSIALTFISLKQFKTKLD